ncbi:hypothetical protein H4219_005447, partial [Mycoemilia scoparia]
LEKDGITIIFPNKQQIHIKIHLAMLSGDIPAIAKAINHTGHMSRYGCRLCKIRGDNGPFGGIYFPKDNFPAPLQTLDEFLTGDPSFNINHSNSFTDLTLFSGPQFFGLEELHLFGHGVARTLWKIFKGEFGNTNRMRLANNQISIISKSMKKSRAQIPTTFYGIEKDIEIHSGYFRGVDWLDFLIYIVPSLVLEFLSDDLDKRAIAHLVKGCSLALKWEISKPEIEEMEKCFERWHNHLQQLVNSNEMLISVFRIT